MASTSSNVPLSEILRSKPSEEEDDEPKKKSREDWRKAKELEEARKAGTAPAAVDEHGRDINPHIPQYISSAPWYFGSRGPTLQHQRIQPDQEKEKPSLDEWYKRGVDTTSQAKKFRKGACENCGAMTHKKKDCLERPRKVLAKYSSALIACDEFVQPNLIQDYDSKRDRWAGYDPSNHKAIVEHYQKIEEAKRELRADKLDAGEHSGGDEDKDDEEDEDKYVDEVDMPGTKVDSKQRITVRNLRIREDTAKYLRNLDPNSAYYDPKTRSMRDNPYETVANPEDVDYAGENFVRFSGDTGKHATAQLFAWEAYEKGVDVHVLAEPTKLELLKKEYEGKKEEFKAQVSSSVIDKYGGAEHLEAPPKQLLLAQTEDYVEYSRYGKVIKGQEKVIVKSRYEEDVYPNNHTSVWGSWWHNGVWGYKCCHSFIKNSYCTGEAGVDSSSNIVGASLGPPPGVSAQQGDVEEESKKSKKKHKKEKKKKKDKEKSSEEKLKEALKKEEEEQKAAERLLKMDERKRGYNSMISVKEPSAEEMEAFMMKRRRPEDPMA
ncbi:hypothetical protein WDU94_013579 [Cyamophila willieti]